MIRSNFDVPRHWSKNQASAVIEFLEAIIIAIWEFYGDAPDTETDSPRDTDSVRNIFDDLPF
jgi:hypothetical protein